MESSATARFPSLPVSKGAATISSTAGADSACRAGLSDETLLANICKGDREALGVLFRRHIRLVHGIGRRILRDSAEAEDLAQDVFLHIVRKCHL